MFSSVTEVSRGNKDEDKTPVQEPIHIDATEEVVKGCTSSLEVNVSQLIGITSDDEDIIELNSVSKKNCHYVNDEALSAERVLVYGFDGVESDRVIMFFPVNIFVGNEIFWDPRLTLTRNHVKLEAEGLVHDRGPISCEWTTADIVSIKCVWSKKILHVGLHLHLKFKDGESVLNVEDLGRASLDGPFCGQIRCSYIKMNTGRGQNKRNWTVDEDHALVESLQEVAVDTNWKNEKGWKDGYMVRVEELMAAKLPMTGIKVNPHIESRWKRLKRKYNAVADMRGSSGFGWDVTTKKIQCDKSVYDEWCKSHKDARGLWGVSFPHFHALGELMRNDRATGSHAEQFSDAIENMGNETTESMFSTSAEDGDQECSSVSKPGKRKRLKDNAEKKLFAMFDDVCRKLGSFMDNVDMHLGKLVASESDDMTGKVMDVLSEMEGLSSGQVLDADEILMAEPHKLKVFYHANAELKKEYILRLLLSNKKK